MWKKTVVFVVIALVVGVIAVLPAAAADPTWTVVSTNSIGCDNNDTNFTTLISNIASFPTNLRFRTIVDAGGLRYMDEDAGSPSTNGLYSWSLYDSSSGGPTTATFPIPNDTEIVVQLLLIDGIGGPAVTGTIVTIDRCNGGTVTSIVPYGGADGGCTNPLPTSAVVRSLPQGAPAFFAADASTATGFNIPAGTWYVVQTSGDFSQLWIACEAGRVWVPTNAVGP